MQELPQKNLRHRNTFGCIKGGRAGTLRQKEAGFYGKGHIPAASKPQYAPYPRRIQPHGGPGLAQKPAAARCGVGVSGGRRHLPAGRVAAQGVSCRRAHPGGCRRADQHHPDRPFGAVYGAGVVSKAGGQGRGGHAGAHYGLCQCGGESGHRV